MAQLSFSFETPSALLAPDEIFDLSDNEELLRRLEESRYWERKPPGIHPKSLGEYFSMWANTAPTGGLLAVGIEDDGDISGCHQLHQDQLNALEKSGHIYCSEARIKTKLVPLRNKAGSQTFIVLFRVFYHEDKVVFDTAGTGSRTVAELTALFDACFRIQREASEAAGRYIPMVVENVKGAQPWVGPAKAHFGSFYLWGDVAMVGNRVVCGVPKFGRDVKARKARGEKVPMNFHEFENTGKPGRSFQSVAVESKGVKQSQGGTWFGDYQAQKEELLNGTKCGGDWFNSEQVSLSRLYSSKSPARKAASAMIAKIPFALAQYVAQSFKPEEIT